jgi:hypothetical protein
VISSSYFPVDIGKGERMTSFSTKRGVNGAAPSASPNSSPRPRTENSYMPAEPDDDDNKDDDDNDEKKGE